MHCFTSNISPEFRMLANKKIGETLNLKNNLTQHDIEWDPSTDFYEIGIFGNYRP